MAESSAQIELKQKAYDVIVSETAKSLPVETGGILLGYHEDMDLVVTDALVVDNRQASTDRYVRDDVLANELLHAFLTQRASDDPTGYIGEWHSHPKPVGPSIRDLAAIQATAKSARHRIALLVHIPAGIPPFVGLVAQPHRGRTVTTSEVKLLFPEPM